MDVQDAVDNFGNAMQHCDNLVVVHRAGRDGTRGRLTVEPSVNRGTIVLAVAAWQAFVQDIAQALCDKTLAELKPVTTTPLTVGAVQQWQADFDDALRKFSTPAPNQLCTLLKRVGFNPRPSWTWTQRGGRGNGTVLVEPNTSPKCLSSGSRSGTPLRTGTPRWARFRFWVPSAIRRRRRTRRPLPPFG